MIAAASLACERDQALRTWRERDGRGSAEPGLARHRSELLRRVGVALRCGREHGQCKRRRHRRRRNAIIIGDEFDDPALTVLAEAGTDFPEEADIGRLVEMVQEVRDQYEVVAAAPVDLERAS